MNKQLILGGLLSLGVSMTSHAETGLYNDNGEHSQYRHLIVFGDSFLIKAFRTKTLLT